jgi:hypothetical protein
MTALAEVIGKRETDQDLVLDQKDGGAGGQALPADMT